MTNAEMRTFLAKAGVTEETIGKISENYDIEKISMIVDAATNPESALNAIHAFYPELEVTKLKEQVAVSTHFGKRTGRKLFLAQLWQSANRYISTENWNW